MDEDFETLAPDLGHWNPREHGDHCLDHIVRQSAFQSASNKMILVVITRFSCPAGQGYFSCGFEVGKCATKASHGLLQAQGTWSRTKRVDLIGAPLVVLSYCSSDCF